MAGTNKCVDAAAEDSTRAQMWQCFDGAANQKWKMDGKALVSMADDQCLQENSQGLWERAKCSDGENKDSVQGFHFDTSTGEVVDVGGKCLTAGWPFVQATAFESPDGEVVVVLLNEADESIAVEIYVGDYVKDSLVAVAPGHSVQTYIL